MSAVRWRMGGWALLANAELYTLVYVFLILGHGRPTVFAPWLAIDPEHYYRWNVFFVGPSMVMGWLLAGAVAHLVAGGRGAFEETLGALGFATALSSWPTLAHDLVTSALGATHVMDQRAYEDAMSTPGDAFHALIWTLMIVYAIAFVVTFGFAIRTTQRIRWLRAAPIGLLAFAIYQLVFLIFNR